jgi:hypothetical protein
MKAADIEYLLGGNRVFVSNGVPAGRATLMGERGRVMAVVGIAELAEYLLALTDTVRLNHSDAGNLAERGRRQRLQSSVRAYKRSSRDEIT